MPHRLILAVAATAVLVPAPVAHAKPKVPKIALFKATVRASQANHVPLPRRLRRGGRSMRVQAIKPKWLYDKGRKVIKLSTDEIRDYHADGFTGQTIVAWNVTLRRVKRP